jgi:hypothetical protein
MSVGVLKKTLSSIKKCIEEILKKIHPIMKKIYERDKEIFLRVSLFKSGTEEEIYKLMEEKCTKILKTPITILDELNTFSEKVITEEDKLETETPFLYLVWTGDYFGEPKIKGLELLLVELKRLETGISEDTFLNAV